MNFMNDFAQKHPKAAEWVRKGGLFLIFSWVVTALKAVMLMFLPDVFRSMVEGTLREFPKFAPVNIWFDYPVHLQDATGCLQDVQPEAELAGWQKSRQAAQPKDRQKERREALEKAFAACDMENTGCVPLVQLITYLGKSKNTIRDYVDEHPGFERCKDGVKRVKKAD